MKNQSVRTMAVRKFAAGASLILALTVPSTVCFAQEGIKQEGTKQEEAADNPADETPKEDPGFWSQDTLTGDWGGVRTNLTDAGLALSGLYTVDAMGNPVGGIKQRGVYMGLVELDADGDLDKLAGWSDATFHISALSFHGRGLSSHFIGNYMTVRNSETSPSTRLWALWLQQVFWDGKASLKVGQTPQDEEFMTSAYGGYFINATYGWPAGFSTNIPTGGGVFPMSVTGARLKVAATDSLTWMLGVFNGEAAVGTKTGQDPTRVNSDGLNFNLAKSPMIMNEFQWTLGAGEDATLPPTTVKLGGWYHAEGFTDLRYDTTGLSLGSPTSNGIGKRVRGNWDVYGVLDTLLIHGEGADDNGLGAFARFSVSNATVSTLPYYGEVGLTYKGLLPDRDNDVLGLAVSYGAVSDNLQAEQSDARALSGSTAVVQDYEMLIETIYRYQVAPWWTLAPDAQYIVHPGGGTGLPDNNAKRIPDAFVLGLRSILKL